MDINGEKIIWHYDILPRKTKKALDFLSSETWLGKSKWYLAGGTALALRVGHRRSVDLDFFTELKNFNTKELLERYSNNPNWKETFSRKNTIYGEFFGAKASFIAYPFFIPKQKPAIYGTIRVLNPIDIGVMKITAISQRGRKRDFFDLYWCANNIESLENIIKRLKAQYPAIAHNYHHILKSLVYFEDAESDPEPEIYFDADWKKIKSFFRKEITLIAKKLIK
ncbi:MAG: nucleotidyl transferase AbiEii/AbiGii toxin family protein [Candidatus Brennerbacteria bacterium]|nr:nucleotidyl transferase AbiEii/AbiGii toxin family protein [Candidatus Brennerbacteria bacterium]